VLEDKEFVTEFHTVRAEGHCLEIIPYMNLIA